MRAILAVLAALVGLAALSPAPAQGWERTYTIAFRNCTPAGLAAFADGIGAFPGLIERRPTRCSGTACTWSYRSRIGPNALLNRLYAMVEGQGRRARISVSGLRYSVTCLPGRRAHPLASEPRREDLATSFREYETDCGALIEAGGDVLFDFASSALRPDAREALRRIAARIRELRPRAVEITGHTDSRGPAAYNRGLSLRRAETVAAFLAGPLGMPRDRLRVRGLGESAPRAPNAYPDGSDYPEGRQANRRVEIFLRTGAAPACADRAAGFRPFTGVRPQRAVPRPPPARRIDPDRW